MSRNVLRVPGTVMSASCLYLIYSLLLTWASWGERCLALPLSSTCVSPLDVDDGTNGCWRMVCVPSCSSASCDCVSHFVTAGRECEAREAGWSQLELLLSPALQFLCV